MQFDNHGNGNGLNDLYVLPESKFEREVVIGFLRRKQVYFQLSFGDVEGSDWYGKSFLEIPFMSSMQPELEDAVKMASKNEIRQGDFFAIAFPDKQVNCYFREADSVNGKPVVTHCHNSTAPHHKAYTFETESEWFAQRGKVMV